VNWGDRIAILNVLLSVGASLGFLCASDWCRSLYFILGAAITYVATFLLR
jgi:membrane-anchored protein YejM (alkaline phosphatase superfamily)